jgi:hypothetical protein
MLNSRKFPYLNITAIYIRMTVLQPKFTHPNKLGVLLSVHR